MSYLFEAPCTGRSGNNYHTKSICRVPGWVGREALLFPPCQPGNSWDTELGRAPSIPKLGREGRDLPAALTARNTSVQLQEHPGNSRAVTDSLEEGSCWEPLLSLLWEPQPGWKVAVPKIPLLIHDLHMEVLVAPSLEFFQVGPPCSGRRGGTG